MTPPHRCLVLKFGGAMSEQSPVPQIKRPSDTLWLIGLGGALALGIAIALTFKAPKEAPGARDYHKSRLRAYGGYARG